MTKILIEESVLRQALEAIGDALSDDKPYINKCRSAFAAVESALDAAEKVEPLFDGSDYLGHYATGDEITITEHHAPAVPEKQGPVTEPSDWDINSMDATGWAKAFAKRFTVWSQEHGVESDTFGLMVGWFANAIMAGYDEATRRNPAPTVPEKVEPICWCMAYDDPAFGRIHSNPSMCEPELDAHIAKCDGRLVKVPLYAAPTPPTNTSDSELREAARAVVEHWTEGSWGSFNKKIDRLRKALEK